jgi:hypothetical protein
VPFLRGIFAERFPSELIFTILQTDFEEPPSKRNHIKKRSTTNGASDLSKEDFDN